MGDQGSGDGSNKLKRFNKIDVNGDHKFLPFEMMGNKHGWLSKVQGPAIQLPVMRVPWDCTGIENQNGQMKAQVSLSFERDSAAHGKLQDLLDALDDRAAKHIIANKAKIWEGKKVPSDEMIADQMYYRIVKPSNQPEKYGPTMKAKLEVRANTAGSSSSAFASREDHAGDDAGEFDLLGDDNNNNKRPKLEPFVLSVGCYTKDGLEVPYSRALAKGCKVRLVVGLRHVWCINGRMGLTLYGHRLIVEEFPRTVNSFDFDLDGDDEEDGEGTGGV